MLLSNCRRPIPHEFNKITYEISFTRSLELSHRYRTEWLVLSVFSSYHSSRICRVPFHSSNLVRIRHLAYPRSLCPSPLPSLALLDPAAYKIALNLTA